MSVEIKNLCKAFNGQQVLKDVNLSILENEIVVLMGPSGCGKTTLLRCLCNLEKADKGTIKINDHYLIQDADGKMLEADKKTKMVIQKDIGLVFQNYQLFPHRTILQNLIDAPIYHKYLNKNDAIKRADALLEKLQITDKRDAYPATLSGGQKQRVAIARACILQPSILCFDEPTSALDSKSVDQVIQIMQELSKEMAILIITHDEGFAKKIGTRIIHIKEINTIKN